MGLMQASLQQELRLSLTIQVLGRRACQSGEEGAIPGAVMISSMAAHFENKDDTLERYQFPSVLAWAMSIHMCRVLARHGNFALTGLPD